MQSAGKTIVRDAALVALGSSLLGLGFNAFRPEPMPVVQHEVHQVLVPCPAEELAPADPIEPADPRIGAADTLVVDSREREEYEAWHLPGAIHVYYDLLEETPEYRQTIAELLERHADARRVVVYGDDEPGLTTASGAPGDEAGTGFRLAGALARQGMRNVFYVPGGSRSLRAAQPPEGAP